MSSVTEMVASGMIGWASSLRSTESASRTAWTDSRAPSGDQSRADMRCTASSATTGTPASPTWASSMAAISSRSDCRASTSAGTRVCTAVVHAAAHPVGDLAERPCRRRVPAALRRWRLPPRPAPAPPAACPTSADLRACRMACAGGGQRAADALLGFLDVAHQAQLHERFAAQDGVGAAEEGSVPAVLALLDGAVEQRRLAAQGVVGRDVAEVLRGLDQRHLVVVEVAQRLVQDVRLGDLVRVEDQQELAVGDHQRIVQVAGLGVARHVRGPVRAARHVAQSRATRRVARISGRSPSSRIQVLCG